MINRKNDNPRLLLARLRTADYTHAGDEEAIDIFLEKIKQLFSSDPVLASSDANATSTNENKKALDAGCGLGGTADYVRKKTQLHVYGVDIDTAAIKHAKQHYREVDLLECDILRVDEIFKKNNFDLIYLFNVFYALPDQQKSLEKLAAVAKPGAILAIFDYTQTKPNKIGLKDLADKQMNPIYLEDMKKWLNKAGWSLIEVVDLSDQYDMWYTKLLENLKSQKSKLLQEFTDGAYDKVLSTFSFLSNKIKNKEMGGSIIYAKNQENLRSRL